MKKKKRERQEKERRKEEKRRKFKSKQTNKQRKAKRLKYKETERVIGHWYGIFLKAGDWICPFIQPTLWDLRWSVITQSKQENRSIDMGEGKVKSRAKAKQVFCVLSKFLGTIFHSIIRGSKGIQYLYEALIGEKL